ncbi:MAG: ABC transporter ATP-binding protein [Bacillota bacterium]
MNEPILSAFELTKTFFLGQTVQAVHDVSLDVDGGDFVVLTGPSGSGKSTLLSLLGGLDRPTSGEVVLDGHRFSRLSESGLAMLRRAKVGFVFQFFNLIPHLTATENVSLPLRFSGFSRRQMERRAQELLEMVGLGDRMHHRPLQLSGGEQQRVAIARALANQPRVVLADEPTGNLDSRNAQEIARLFANFNCTLGQTFVVVSHNEAFHPYAKRVVRMLDGRLVDSLPA